MSLIIKLTTLWGFAPLAAPGFRTPEVLSRGAMGVSQFRCLNTEIPPSPSMVKFECPKAQSAFFMMHSQRFMAQLQQSHPLAPEW